jgi:TRAP-type mannitol/chloroaromatic compound transport system permease small subunit
MRSNGLRRLIDILSRTGALVAGTLVMALILLTVADVVWRNANGRSIPGVYEYSEVILVTIVFLSLAWTQKTDSHVSIDLVTRALPARVKLLIQALGLAISFGVLVWMTYASAGAAWESWLTGEYRIGLSQVPVWPARFAVVIGLCVLVFQLVASLFDLFSQRGRV